MNELEYMQMTAVGRRRRRRRPERAGFLMCVCYVSLRVGLTCYAVTADSLFFSVGLSVSLGMMIVFNYAVSSHLLAN